MAEINIVLVEPQIPQNTGNIARTCAVTGARLHLVKPMGFAVDDKKLKHAGLDYWHMLDITYYDSLEDFLDIHKDESDLFYFFSTKSKKVYSDEKYPKKSYLFFGREDRGLPESLLLDNREKCVRIPMMNEARSLNLSNSVAIGVYEVLRQQNFPSLTNFGTLFD